MLQCAGRHPPPPHREEQLNALSDIPRFTTVDSHFLFHLTSYRAVWPSSILHLELPLDLQLLCQSVLGETIHSVSQ